VRHVLNPAFSALLEGGRVCLRIDVFARHSTGGLIAWLARCSSRRILRCTNQNPADFCARVLKKFFPATCAIKYGNDGLIKVAYDTFGRHLEIRPCGMPGVNLKERYANDQAGACEFFNNFSGSPSSKDKIADVAIRTASGQLFSQLRATSTRRRANDPSLRPWRWRYRRASS